ncbi:HAMP domain-containing histidine kinase [Pelagibacteraceae bacterium]|nr:HAMP domain-containing histidine kinase [Pelagibacteraceae bacterium]
MVLDIHGVIKRLFSLSSYNLTFQLIILNLIILLLGLLFLSYFNFYLIQNNKFIDNRDKSIKLNLSNITKYLENTSILRVPIFQYDYRCRYLQDIEAYNESCDLEDNINPIELSEPELEKFTTEQFIFQNFGDKDFNTVIYNENWIKIADSSNIFLSTDVEEIDLSETRENIIDLPNFFENIYINNFNHINNYVLKNKFNKNLDKNVHEIILIIDTIKNKQQIVKTFKDENNDITRILTSPITQDSKVFGVVLIKYKLLLNNDELARQSLNLFNFFLLFILVTILLSFIFLRGLITPLRQLTKITVLERDKTNKKKLIYPVRSDEIGILSNQIQLMSKELKSQINQLEKFSSDVAHELKNPLTAIKSSIELLASKNITKENRSKLMSNFNKDIDRMNKLISDISHFSKTIAEIEIENFEQTNVNKFLNENFGEKSTNKKNIKILLQTDNNKNLVLLNKDKFLQVILNLIDNSVSIAENNSNILITSNKKNENCVEIKIYDQGKGIDLKERNKIFDRFYTDRRDNRDQHSGLGLSISYEIINLFNGSIELTESDKLDFRGACFLIKLPLKSKIIIKGYNNE